ncbi:MAG: carbon-nitrogen hydrolase family protein [Microbacterium sp.]
MQAEAVPGAWASNLAKAARLTEQAGAAGADLIVFPEAFVTGYAPDLLSGALPSSTDLSWSRPLQDTVDCSGVVVIINTALDHGDRRALSDIMLAPYVAPQAVYDKQHLYAGECEVFTPGAQGATISVRGIQVALSVCFDGDFPEHAAAAAADGAIVYVNSGAYFAGSAERRDLRHAARALDNGVYVVFAGLVGAPAGFIGGSAIFDPLGTRIASTAAHEGLAIADIDPAAVESARSAQRAWAQRRASLGPRRHSVIG